MQVIFYISLSFTGVSEKIKSKILVTCKILDFPFFRVRPKTYSTKQESIRSEIAERSRVCPMKTILIIRSP